MAGEFTYTHSYIHAYKSFPSDLGSFSVAVEVWSGDDIPEWCNGVNCEHSKFNPLLSKSLKIVFFYPGCRFPDM